MRAFAKQHSLTLYFVLAFAWFWGCIALGFIDRFRFWVPMLGAIAPAISAVIVTSISEGEAEMRNLLGRLGKWRVGWKWYFVALGLPLAGALLAAGVASSFGAFKPARINIDMLRAILPTIWIVFLFAAGEELGWRGYALPRLLSRHNAIYASVILGMLHTVWHWPLILLPHQMLSDIPILPWTISIVAEAVVFTWIFRHTGGSVLMAALYHGMSNVASILYDGIDPAWMPRLRSTISVLVAVTIVLSVGTELMRKPAPRAEAARI
jgi:membrane protease YdiL (CAAX protease family)